MCPNCMCMLMMLWLCGSIVIRSSQVEASIASDRAMLNGYMNTLRSSMEYIVRQSSNLNGSGIGINRIDFGEAHMIYKIERSLLALLQRGDDAVIHQLRHGYQCTAHDQLQQLALSKRITTNLCSEIEWYKLAAVGAPHIKVIVDVGSNKAFLSALFLSLWGKGAAKISPESVYSIASRKGFVADTQRGQGGKVGHCRYGSNLGMGLTCASVYRDNVTMKCTEPRKDGDEMILYSFDGSSGVARLTNTVIKELHKAELIRQGQRNINATSVHGMTMVGDKVWWEHRHEAVGSGVYQANFTLASLKPGDMGKGVDTLIDSGFEGGTLWLKRNPQEGGLQRFEVVNVTTIDEFAKSIGSVTLDFIKIDAEGKDRDVLIGAENQIKNKVSLFSFECAPCALKEAELLKFSKWGFSCYSLSRAGLFKWTSNCASSTFWQVRKKSIGNVLCASRTRAPLLALSLDLLSFPYMLAASNVTVSQSIITRVTAGVASGGGIGRNVASIRPAVPSNQTGQRQGKPRGKGSFLSRRDSRQIFIRWNAFCFPWPGCMLSQ